MSIQSKGQISGPGCQQRSLQLRPDPSWLHFGQRPQKSRLGTFAIEADPPAPCAPRSRHKSHSATHARLLHGRGALHGCAHLAVLERRRNRRCDFRVQQACEGCAAIASRSCCDLQAGSAALRRARSQRWPLVVSDPGLTGFCSASPRHPGRRSPRTCDCTVELASDFMMPYVVRRGV